MKAITTTVLLLATTHAVADSKSAKSAQPKPEPTDPKLAGFVGRWEGVTTLRIRKETFTMTATASCERAAVGPAIVCSSVIVDAKGPRRLEEMWLLGHDKASDTYHLFTVNNWGEAYDHAGKITDARKMTFEHVGTRDGKVLREVYAAEVSEKQLVLKGTISIDGGVFAEGVSTMKRVP